MAIKTNSNFPQYRSLRNLPTIQGAILLLDAEDGTPLAFLDSMEITLKRMGVATAADAHSIVASRSPAPSGKSVDDNMAKSSGVRPALKRGSSTTG